MKRIDAVIKPHKREEVKDSLTALGASEPTVIEAKGFGRQKGHTELYRGTEYTVDFQPKLLISVIVAEDIVEAVVKAIADTARNRHIHSGVRVDGV